MMADPQEGGGIMDYTPLVEDETLIMVLGGASIIAIVLGVLTLLLVTPEVGRYDEHYPKEVHWFRIAGVAGIILGIIGFIGSVMWSENVNSKNLSIIQHNMSVKYMVDPQDVSYNRDATNQWNSTTNGDGSYVLTVRGIGDAQEAEIPENLTVRFKRDGEPMILSSTTMSPEQIQQLERQ